MSANVRGIFNHVLAKRDCKTEKISKTVLLNNFDSAVARVLVAP